MTEVQVWKILYLSNEITQPLTSALLIFENMIFFEFKFALSTCNEKTQSIITLGQTVENHLAYLHPVICLKPTKPILETIEQV